MDYSEATINVKLNQPSFYQEYSDPSIFLQSLLHLKSSVCVILVVLFQFSVRVDAYNSDDWKSLGEEG